jgi:hypothetical protein
METLAQPSSECQLGGYLGALCRTKQTKNPRTPLAFQPLALSATNPLRQRARAVLALSDSNGCMSQEIDW